MEIICGIYKITSPSKKIYIGQSIDIYKRFYCYKLLHCKEQTRLYNSFKKYTPGKHKFEIIHQCERKQLNEFEIYYIELYQCFNTTFGLNLHLGGNNHTCSYETRQKIREKRLLQIMPPVSEKTREKLRQNKIYNTSGNFKAGHIAWNKGHKGKVVTEETKEKIRKKLIGLKPKKTECPFCYKKIDMGNAKRWHFNNCKQ